jgi:hypothetical protein
MFIALDPGRRRAVRHPPGFSNVEVNSSMNPKKKIKRSELYCMVWEEALSKLAPKLGLSDVGLRKICKRYDIPLPSQGYWARSLERRSPKRTPLPQPDKDWDLEFIIPPQATPEGQSELNEKFGPQIAAESLPENQIAVVANEESRHPMTRAVAKLLEKAGVDQYGGITCATPTAFRVRVPPESIYRALGIIDALAAAFDVRGLAIEKGAENGTAGVGPPWPNKSPHPRHPSPPAQPRHALKQ